MKVDIMSTEKKYEVIYADPRGVIDSKEVKKQLEEWQDSITAQ